MDLQPDARKLQMMIFSGKNSQTLTTFDEYMRDYGTPDLFLPKTWKKDEPILLADKVDEVYERFFDNEEKDK